MLGKQHIEKMKLIGKYLDGTLNAPEARAAAVEYAHKLTTDTGLQEMVRQSFPKDLAERDIKRAALVPPAYKLKPGEGEALGFIVPCGTSYALTEKGKAWKDAGRPDPTTWTPQEGTPPLKHNPPVIITPTPVKVEPTTPLNRQDLASDYPW